MHGVSEVPLNETKEGLPYRCVGACGFSQAFHYLALYQHDQVGWNDVAWPFQNEWRPQCILSDAGSPAQW